MERRSFVGALLGTIGGLRLSPMSSASLLPNKYEVTSLEHEAWGFSTTPHKVLPVIPDAKRGESRYITRWTFSSEKEAINFVQSLTPEIAEIWTKRQDGYNGTDQIESGYRKAVRFEIRGEITDYKVKLVSVNPDGSAVDVELNRPLFWSIADAWGWLANLRLNGQPISMTRNGYTGLSVYLIQPFRRGTPIIHEE